MHGICMRCSQPHVVRLYPKVMEVDTRPRSRAWLIGAQGGINAPTPRCAARDVAIQTFSGLIGQTCVLELELIGHILNNDLEIIAVSP